MNIKRLQAGLYLNQETGVVTYCGVNAALDNWKIKLQFTELYKTTVCPSQILNYEKLTL